MQFFLAKYFKKCLLILEYLIPLQKFLNLTNMKKLMLFIAISALFISACGTETESNTTDSVATEQISPEKKLEIEKIESESDKLNSDAQKLDNKADSILNSL